MKLFTPHLFLKGSILLFSTTSFHRQSCFANANETTALRKGKTNQQRKYRSLQLAPKPPRANKIMNYGFNVFTGLSPEEQSQNFIGRKLFDYTGGDLFNTDDKFKVYDQMVDISSSSFCESESSSSMAVYITGYASLSFQGTSFFKAESQFSDEEFIVGAQSILQDFVQVGTEYIDQVFNRTETIVNDAVGQIIGTVENSVEEITDTIQSAVGQIIDTVENFIGQIPGLIDSAAVHLYHIVGNFSIFRRKKKGSSGLFDGLSGVLNNNVIKALTFEGATVQGNTRASMDAQANLRAGYSWLYTRYALQTLYSAMNDINNIRSWTSEFRSATRELGTYPSDQQVLEFFAKFGTHAIKKAVMGQKCEASISMTGGSTSEVYTSAVTDGSIGGEVWWNPELSGEIAADIEGQYEANGFHYKISNRVCNGRMMNISPCAGILQDFGVNEPTMLDYTYYPIYNIQSAGLSNGARERMEAVVTNLKIAQLKCSKENCNGHGACTPKISAWGNINALKPDYLDFWNGEHCFCQDGYYGEDCEEGFFLNKVAYGSDKTNEQRLWNNVLNVCPLSGLLSKDSCKDAASFLGAGNFNYITLNDPNLPSGCLASPDPDRSEVLYNEGAYKEWDVSDGEIGGFWEFVNPSHYIPVCKMTHETSTGDNCADGTFIERSDCCLAAASLNPTLDQEIATREVKVESDNSVYESLGACEVKITKYNSGKTTLEYRPYEIESADHLKGCYIHDGLVFYNTYEGDQTNELTGTAVCLNGIGELPDYS